MCFFGNTKFLEPCSSKSIDISFGVILRVLLGYVRLQFQIGQYLTQFLSKMATFGEKSVATLGFPPRQVKMIT